MKRKALVVSLVICVFWLGCAGRTGNPIQVRQFGDEQKSCKQLLAEMSFIESEFARLMPGSSKTGQNIACTATGIFFIVPLFFIDIKQGAKKEISAYQQRYNYLLMLAKQKECKLPEIATEAEGTAKTSELTEKPEPRVIAAPESSAYSSQQRPRLVVKGIVYNQTNPSALIGTEIVHEGDNISGAQVVKIRRDSVEFSFNGTTWQQGVSR